MSYVVQQFKYYVSYVFNGNDDDMYANITLNISHENGTVAEEVCLVF